MSLSEQLFRTKPVQNVTRVVSDAAAYRLSTWETQGIFNRTVAATQRVIELVDPEIRAGVLRLLRSIVNGKFSPQVIITLITIACINVVRSKNFGSSASKVVFRLANEILDLLQNIGKQGGKEFILY